jgi:Tol biopolymer transport system component
MDSPVDVTIEALDTSVNTSATEIYPLVTHDENTLIFIRRLKFYDAILMVTRQGNSWSLPVNLNPQIGSDGDYYPVSFSFDGNTMFLVRKSGENRDLYVSYKKNNIWSKAQPLSKAINSSADETWACLSPDGRTLWFTSNRRGGEGGLDIWFATLNKNNSWSKVTNAGKTINTQFDEESPFITGNNLKMYFSSRGHSGMGGYDIFFSVLNGKKWTKPVNIGYPINNTSDNLGYVPLNDGQTGYYSFDDPKRNNSQDVYRIKYKNPPIP